MSAVSRVKSGSIGNGDVGRAVAEPKHAVGACRLLSVSVGD